MISKKLLEEVEYYSNHPWDEVKDDIKTDTEKLDALNKGIDELIKKYASKVNHLTLLRGIDEKCNIHNAETRAKQTAYQEIIQDLKKLKGE